MGRMLPTVLVGVILGMGCSEGTRVEMVDYYGTVSFKEGVTQYLTCSIEDPEELAVVTWRVGDRALDPRECLEGAGCLAVPGQDEEQDYENEIQETIIYVPKFEDDGKEVFCEYGVPGEELQSDSFRVLVFQQEFHVESPRPGREGETLTMQVTAILYPAPIEKDFTWKVEKGKTTILELHPGQKDEYGRYQAGSIREVGEHQYRMELVIPSMSAAVAGYRHSLVITSNTTATKTLQLNTPFMPGVPAPDKPPSPPSASPEEGNPEESEDGEESGYGEEFEDGEEHEDSEEAEKSEEPGVAMSGLGMIIIVGLLIFCLLLCIVFCILRKRRKQRQRRDGRDGKGAFTIVPTTVAQGGKAPPAHPV